MNSLFFMICESVRVTIFKGNLIVAIEELFVGHVEFSDQSRDFGLDSGGNSS